ncbi:hypothetical protein KFL_000170550 [Klebsormidium nitens]|uniref:Uncharacterized protein n=1 Tax=Klebsormidium nitens TaxID=105231 RepID=A0A1Y1HNG2_KLENI|nr:hypothetical protein KFL_000170550 [Klebsormidium nitens]|eukprot:GAQ78709.1 hypothetical protein KFL_000170550 [Klebsormidium nitens]
MADLFEELPEDANHLICRFTSSLDLDLGEIWPLRQVSKTWKQAVEEGHLGEAGRFHKPGLLTFACRVVDAEPGRGKSLLEWQNVYPGLGVLNEDRTVLHVHPFRKRTFGKGLTEAQSSAVWVDIPESTVVVNRAVYVLSEPKRAPSDVYLRVREFRLRSFDLTSREGCWKERSSLQLTEEEAPLSPTAEGFVFGFNFCTVQTSFTVVASQRYVFVLHYAIPSVVSEFPNRWFAIIRSSHGSLYDTLSDTWRPFALPPHFLPPTPRTGLNDCPSRFHEWKEGDVLAYLAEGRKVTEVMCAASADAIVLLNGLQKKVWLHSLAERELDQPWKAVSFGSALGEQHSPEEISYSSLTAVSGVPDAFAFSFLRTTGPGAPSKDIIKAKSAPQGQSMGIAENDSSTVLAVTDETRWLAPENFDGRYHEDLHDVHGELLVFGKEAGRWQGSKKHGGISPRNLP